MANKTLGLPVNFGFTGTDGIAATEFTGKIILQNVDYSEEYDEEQVKTAVGTLATRHFYNESQKATLEYIITGATVAAARTNSALPAVGTIVNITTCADLPAMVKTNWIVMPGGKIGGSNTSGKRVSLNLEAHPGITAVATAA